MEETGQLHNFDIIHKGDPRIESYLRDAVMSGSPDAVIRPRDWREVKDILTSCNGNKTPVTVCGARTSMTGSSIAMEGALVTTDRFNKILDIGEKDGKPYAVVEPAVIARDFQKAVEECGFHYPVVPTSCNEAFIGGTVATNATGEDFYKYGPTRNFVREITLLKMDGSARHFSRSPNHKPKISKGLGGYFMDGEEIDYIIGSEGTLGVISRITLDLLPSVPKIFIILLPFHANMEALAFIDSLNSGDNRPRALEFIDSYALSLMITHASPPKFSDKVKALVYIKDEYAGDSSEAIEKWFGRISKLSCRSAIIDEAIAAVTDKQKEEFHGWRHHIPMAIAELHERHEKAGGGKVAGDWWVPRPKMIKMMEWVYKESPKLGLPFTAFGHLGDGHPHINYICKTSKEKEAANALLLAQCKRAVEFGGGVAAEHGIGKLKTNLLPMQHSGEIIEKMRALKSSFDPKWLLGKGNIFACHSRPVSKRGVNSSGNLL
ncbi:MAG: FAD-binding oxidoreductase [Deltaproteobacteria bacterium]|nr:FAD-binding oxidoreductase [Deltaproteobacteria bacterium]